MQKITVNTGLSSFLLIDSITHVDERYISGIKTYTNAPAYLGLESLAQLGAFHVRYLTRFEKHAFLLKMTRCLMPVPVEMNGKCELSARLAGQSKTAFSHILEAKKGGNILMEGEFVFATVDYDQNFKKEILYDHYRNVFSCLKNDSKAD